MTARTREQQRALHAYQCVEAVLDDKQRNDYKARVHGLGSAVLREGLAAALTFLEREKENAATAKLLDDVAAYLATAGLPGLEEARPGSALPAVVRGLPLEEYMLATREVLKLLVWFRRAVQATFTKQQGATHAQRAE